MAVVGYRRVSSASQSLDRQELEGCDKVFEEKVTGAKRDRPELNRMMDYIRDGDEVRVHSIDRLARDLRDLQSIIEQINDKDATITFLKEKLTFKPSAQADPFAKLQLHLMGAFAEFERSIIRERQREGIARAKERGVYAGRKTSIDVDKVKSLHASGVGASEIAKALGIGRASVYRLLSQQ
jgi:DNA invertase Pin-like site-specific DNA recombinase